MFKFKILIESEIKREGLLKSAFYNENFIVVPENVVFFIKFFEAMTAFGAVLPGFGRSLFEILTMFLYQIKLHAKRPKEGR